MMKVICCLLACLSIQILAGDIYQEINLQGAWKFITGDNPDYANQNWNDSQWKSIQVPGKWEDQGYKDHDGYAWYRTRVRIPASLGDDGIVLRLGKIDDVDMVFLNGQFLQGRGSFPPHYQTAFNWDRQYLVPPDMIHFDKDNVIAVRIYDEWGDGGITSGPIGLYSQPLIKLSLNLSGNWSFTTGDQPEYSEPEFNDQTWRQVRVPCAWENQGAEDYNGYAWYRKSVKIPGQLQGDKVILVLGRIDDSDEVYFNGIRIGRTGGMPKGNETVYTNSWQLERFYYLPPHAIHWNDTNLIAVRVYDQGGSGGIYEGPIGLATKKAFLQYKNRNSD
jgi:hypothetical protein